MKGNKRSGKGKYTSASGKVYEGEWCNGNKNGRGKLTGPSGKTYEGEWRNGNENGKGTVTWPDGRKFEGVFVNGDIKHGEPSKMTRGDVDGNRIREGRFDESWKVWLEAAPLPTYAEEADAANRAYWQEQLAQHKGNFYDFLGGSKSKTKRRESKNKKCKSKYKYQKNKKECSFKNNTNKKRRQSHRK
jgi:hypothetical protein